MLTISILNEAINWKDPAFRKKLLIGSGIGLGALGIGGGGYLLLHNKDNSDSIQSRTSSRTVVNSPVEKRVVVVPKESYEEKLNRHTKALEDVGVSKDVAPKVTLYRVSHGQQLFNKDGVTPTPHASVPDGYKITQLPGENVVEGRINGKQVFFNTGKPIGQPSIEEYDKRKEIIDREKPISAPIEKPIPYQYKEEIKSPTGFGATRDEW